MYNLSMELGIDSNTKEVYRSRCIFRCPHREPWATRPSFGSLSLGPLFHPKFLWISPRRKLGLGSGGLCWAIDFLLFFSMIIEQKQNLSFFPGMSWCSCSIICIAKLKLVALVLGWICFSNYPPHCDSSFFRSETNVTAIKTHSCVIQIYCLGVDQHVTWPSNGYCEYLCVIHTSYRYYVVGQSIDQNTSGTKPIIELFSLICQTLCDIKREQ